MSIHRTTPPPPGATSYPHRHYRIGLLIAVGLEQSIQALHRHHERIEPKTASSKTPSATRNSWKPSCSGITRLVMLPAHMSSASGKLQPSTAAFIGHSLTFTSPTMSPTKPSMEAWEAAKEDSTVSLLPHDRVVAYGRVYLELQQELPAYAALNLNHDALSVFTERLTIPILLHPARCLCFHLQIVTAW